MNLKNARLCPSCGEYHSVWFRCPLKFNVYHSGYFGEEGMIIRADSFAAAELYAKYYDQNGSQLLNGEEIGITIKDEKGNTKRFKCKAKLEIKYSVKEM